MLELSRCSKMKYDMNDDDWTIYNRYELAFNSKYLRLYDDEYKKLCSLYPNCRLTYGKSINELYLIAENQSLENESTYLFPGDDVSFYPIVEVLKARKIHTCFVSGALIYPGSEYIRYKAFLYNKTNGNSYVTPSIDLEVGCDFSLPLTLEDFVLFCLKLNCSYEQDLEVGYNILSSLHSPLIRSLRKHN